MRSIAVWTLPRCSTTCIRPIDNRLTPVTAKVMTVTVTSQQVMPKANRGLDPPVQVMVHRVTSYHKVSMTMIGKARVSYQPRSNVTLNVRLTRRYVKARWLRVSWVVATPMHLVSYLNHKSTGARCYVSSSHQRARVVTTPHGNVLTGGLLRVATICQVRSVSLSSPCTYRVTHRVLTSGNVSSR